MLMPTTRCWVLQQHTLLSIRMLMLMTINHHCEMREALCTIRGRAAGPWSTALVLAAAPAQESGQHSMLPLARRACALQEEQDLTLSCF